MTTMMLWVASILLMGVQANHWLGLACPDTPKCSDAVFGAIMDDLSDTCKVKLMDAMNGPALVASEQMAQCECMVALTPEQFSELTGVDARSCGVTKGTSMLADYERCRAYLSEICPTDNLMPLLVPGVLPAHCTPMFQLQMLCLAAPDHPDCVAAALPENQADPLVQCECFTTLTIAEFQATTGLDAETCGISPGISMRRDREMCVARQEQAAKEAGAMGQLMQGGCTMEMLGPCMAEKTGAGKLTCIMTEATVWHQNEVNVDCTKAVGAVAASMGDDDHDECGSDHGHGEEKPKMDCTGEKEAIEG